MAVTTDADPALVRPRPPGRDGPGAGRGGLANLACVGARGGGRRQLPATSATPSTPRSCGSCPRSIDGLAEACRGPRPPGDRRATSASTTRAAGADIDPTPVIGALGLVERAARPTAGHRLGATARRVVLLGARGGRRGTPPARREPLGGRVRGASAGAGCRRSTWRPTAGWSSSWPGWWPSGRRAATGLLDGVHDVSAGGLGVALAEMAVAAGVGRGSRRMAGHAELFTELPSRVVVATDRPDELLARAARGRGAGEVLGRAGGDRLVVERPGRPGAVERPGRRPAAGALPRALGEAV